MLHTLSDFEINENDELLKAIINNNLEEFYKQLAVMRSYPDFTMRITKILSTVLNKYIAHLGNRHQMYYKHIVAGEVIFKPIQAVIIAALLEEGADPFVKHIIFSPEVAQVCSGIGTISSCKY